MTMAFDKRVPLINALVHINLCENRYKCILLSAEN